jgi:acetyl-CoA acetyltransferase|tara:strand:- start:94986 stop:96179 length:1194 start_codon:yes stop_codon:yes gene_type:complete
MSADYIGEKNVAISGIGQSEVGRPSQQSAMQLTADACFKALADAGLTKDDIDGVACWPGDNNNGDAFSPIGPNALISTLGLKVNWFGAGYEAPGPLAGIINGAMAIATGLCKHVLVFRTITESSRRQTDKTASALNNKTIGRDSSFFWQWYTPFNVRSAINLAAMYAQRHFHEYGTTEEQLAQIALTCRKNAELNPNAVFRAPLSMEQYLSSRMISSPLRLFDCDVHCDNSIAIILSRKDIAQDLRNPPICIDGIGSALKQPWSWDQIDLTGMAAIDAAEMMWRRSDYKPKDIGNAQLYDGFSIFALIWLEALGLCPKGESGAFVEGGSRISRQGELPINTNGGQLSGGRTHGLGYVVEACEQLWGRSGERQLAAHNVAVAAAGGGPLASSLLLVKE